MLAYHDNLPGKVVPGRARGGYTTPLLPHSFPELPTDPLANVYYVVDLAEDAPGFDQIPGGGIRVEMFSDLKRHDMGPALAESTGGPLDPMFVTARLWGIADTAPYMHDGRALTLKSAIDMHGGEALLARNNFNALLLEQQSRLVAFLQSLRTPEDPAEDLDLADLQEERGG